MLVGCRGNSAYPSLLSLRSGWHINHLVLVRYSIIEGTKASLQRLGLEYVDVIFAHRPDITGAFRHTVIGARLHKHIADTQCDSNFVVPMEEIVRAFNFVIEKGWVRHHDSFSIPVLEVNCGCEYMGRLSIGLRPNGALSSLRRLIVRSKISAYTPVRNLTPYLFLDVASKLNLVGPIAEQCQHQYDYIHYDC